MSSLRFSEDRAVQADNAARQESFEGIVNTSPIDPGRLYRNTLDRRDGQERGQLGKGRFRIDVAGTQSTVNLTWIGGPLHFRPFPCAAPRSTALSRRRSQLTSLRNLAIGIVRHATHSKVNIAAATHQLAHQPYITFDLFGIPHLLCKWPCDLLGVPHSVYQPTNRPPQYS